jgi:hypothetical protein
MAAMSVLRAVTLALNFLANSSAVFTELVKRSRSTITRPACASRSILYKACAAAQFHVPASGTPRGGEVQLAAGSHRISTSNRVFRSRNCEAWFVTGFACAAISRALPTACECVCVCVCLCKCVCVFMRVCVCVCVCV